MTNHDVVKELLALGKEITNEIKKTSISDDFDAGYKEGLSTANDMIYARLEKLLGEGRLEKEAAAATTTSISVVIHSDLNVIPLADVQKIRQELHRYITQNKQVYMNCCD
ncbi:hypothetical protein [Anoxybacteroides rupiense]|uniref:hypothetical protein n=1 Tax=Anoxybacteroides rupiense TaxID=311460 RepID=UPI001F090AAA|nr:hypothetical protein [Anoxybacillus rupiensis]